MARRKRNDFISVRVTPSERREAALLAKARGLSKSELVRTLVREAVEQETVGEQANGRDRRAKS